MAEFRSGDNDLLIGEVRDDIRRRHAEAAEMALGEAWPVVFTEDARQMGQITRTGVRMSVLPSTANMT